jgi:myosin heavy subunit
VYHTAKPVDYCVNGFRAKNTDEVRKELSDVIGSCSDPTLSAILAPDSASVGTSKFLGAKFRAQMTDLMTELQKCDCHFIRCVKPNETKRAWMLVPSLVL